MAFQYHDSNFLKLIMFQEGKGSETCCLPADFWIVIAAYNEESRIGRVLDELLAIAPHIVVVDDGSTDATAAQLLKRPVWLLRHVMNLGQGAALQTGITFALKKDAGHIATFDADGQHAPTDLLAMYAALQAEAADFALGSRFLGRGRADGIPLIRYFTLRLAVHFTRLMSGLPLSDTHNGIRVFSRRGAEQLHISLDRMEHASQIIDQIAESGLKYIEVPVQVTYTNETLAKGQKISAATTLALKIILEKLYR